YSSLIQLGLRLVLLTDLYKFIQFTPRLVDRTFLNCVGGAKVSSLDIEAAMRISRTTQPRRTCDATVPPTNPVDARDGDAERAAVGLGIEPQRGAGHGQG